MKSSDQRDDVHCEFKTTIDFAVCLSTQVLRLQLKGLFTCQTNKADPLEANKYFFIPYFIEVFQWHTQILNLLL